MEELTENRRGVGRPRITEILGITNERIVSLYKELGTLKLVGERLGVTPRTLRKYLKASGVKPIGPRPTARSWLSKRPSVVYLYMKECAEKCISIPRNTRKIAELSGCTRRQVQDFVERRRKAAKKLIESKGSIPKNTVLQDTLGRRFKSNSIDQFTIVVDTFDLTVKLTCVLRTGVQTIVQTPLSQYIAMLNETPGTTQNIEGTSEST